MNTVSLTQGFSAEGSDLAKGRIVEPGLQGPAAVEVTVIWNGTVQEVNQFRIDGEDPVSFTIGETPDSEYLVPLEDLDGNASLPLVSASDGVVRIASPLTAKVELGRSDGTACAREPGHSYRDDTTGTDIHVLEPGRQAVVTIGNTVFRIRPLDRVEQFTPRNEVDWESGKFFGVSALLHAIFFSIVALAAPVAKGMNLDRFDEENRFHRIILSSAEVKVAPLPEVDGSLEKEPLAPSQARHRGLSGKAGDPRAHKTKRRFGIKGPRDNTRIVLGRDMLKEMAAEGGVLAHMGSYDGPVSPFGASPLGADPENALGDLSGDRIGRSFGYHGLYMHGTGRGGGGPALNTIGDNPLQIPGARPGRTSPLKGLSPPKTRARLVVKETGITHLGSISKDVIRRMVKRRLNQVKFCYEEGLKRRSDLDGRVAVKFTISGTGSVLGAGVSSSTLGDPAVERCIANVIKRISFPPPPDRGVVVVNYPFVLSSLHGN